MTILVGCGQSTQLSNIPNSVSPSSQRVIGAPFTRSEESIRAESDGKALIQNRPTISDDQIAANVDASLSPDAKKIITDLMYHLPTYGRDNVLLFTLDGRVLSNHTALAAAAKSYKIEGVTYTDADGRIHAVPAFEQKPNATTRMPPGLRPLFGTPPSDSGNTGAFRRLYTTNSNSSAIQYSLQIQCGNTSLISGYETPYAR